MVYTLQVNAYSHVLKKKMDILRKMLRMSHTVRFFKSREIFPQIFLMSTARLPQNGRGRGWVRGRGFGRGWVADIKRDARRPVAYWCILVAL